jgi:hypothetical protein
LSVVNLNPEDHAKIEQLIAELKSVLDAYPKKR